MAGFSIVGRHGGRFFSNPPPPPSIKTDTPPWGAPLPLKNEAPHLKNNPLLQSEALFQEMIPRKKSRKIGK